MKYFKESEFMMGTQNVFYKMDKDLLKLLDKLRGRVGKPLSINSRYRDKTYNKLKGGSSRSQHLTGNAVDFKCNNGTLRAKIVKEALKLGLTCGVAKTFVHVDNRRSQIVYSY